MRWFFPSFYGDFRLEAMNDGKRTSLIAEKATPAERKILSEFLKAARKKKWLEHIAPKELEDTSRLSSLDISLDVDVAAAGKLLLKFAKPKKATLTAVKSVDGKIEVVEGTDESAITKLMAEDTTAAASVSRPTLCCPVCMEGEVNVRASEVLQTFMSDEQHERWASKRQLVAVGNLTGHRYLVSHRQTKQAALQGKICMDLDDRAVLHFHNSFIPPEEEVLSTKLILEHREHWLRNEATMNGLPGVKFKNPFGDYLDGVDSAGFVAAAGEFARALLNRS